MGNYAVVDLEMCRVPRDKQEKFGYRTELIQIGAVLINEKLEISDSFMTYVKPVFGAVDTFIEKLTGITQKDVENAKESKEAIEEFISWLPEDVEIVSWSYSDADQIIAELDGKEIDNPRMEELLDTWIDCQYTFGEKMNNPDKSYKLSEALNIADIYYNEGEHDALIDAKNTALLFIKMNTEDEFKVSPYIINSI